MLSNSLSSSRFTAKLFIFSVVIVVIALKVVFTIRCGMSEIIVNTKLLRSYATATSGASVAAIRVVACSISLWELGFELRESTVKMNGFKNHIINQ